MNENRDTNEIKRRITAALAAIDKLEATYHVQLNQKEKVAYCEKLQTFPAIDIAEAVQECQKKWKPGFGINFPSLYDLLDFVTTIQGRRILKSQTAEILQREVKPLEKHDLTKNAVRIGVTKEQINEWRELGMRAQRAYQAELAQNREWQSIYERFGRPGLNPPEARTWDSPEEKYEWKRAMEVSQGWRDAT